MSCPSASGSEASGTRSGGERPVHNWRPTVIHGGVLWLLLGIAAALPLSGPLEIGVAVVAVFAAPVVPVSLYCDYRQARATNQRALGVVAYVSNLGRDILTTVRHREPLGSDRRRLGC